MRAGISAIMFIMLIGFKLVHSISNRWARAVGQNYVEFRCWFWGREIVEGKSEDVHLMLHANR